jgi:nucleotide-binding universal stress UspA family protein
MAHKQLGALVGVDGSEPSLLAASWAARDAAAAGHPMTVCYVNEGSLFPGSPLPGRVWREAQRFGQDRLDRALERIRHEAPEVAVTGRVADGNPAAELLRQSADAEQVVLGSRGKGGLEKLVLGSVGAEVAAHATCPVIVVRGRVFDRDDVVVGVDAVERSDHALAYAFAYADRHGAGVRAVHAVRHPAPAAGSDWDRRSADQPSAARDLLVDALLPWARAFPTVRIESTVVDGTAAGTMIRASQGAALIVVGSRGRGGFTGRLPGSVSQALLRHADCPVAVVR